MYWILLIKLLLLVVKEQVTASWHSTANVALYEKSVIINDAQHLITQSSYPNAATYVEVDLYYTFFLIEVSWIFLSTAPTNVRIYLNGVEKLNMASTTDYSDSDFPKITCRIMEKAYLFRLEFDSNDIFGFELMAPGTVETSNLYIDLGETHWDDPVSVLPADCPGSTWAHMSTVILYDYNEGVCLYTSEPPIVYECPRRGYCPTYVQEDHYSNLPDYKPEKIPPSEVEIFDFFLLEGEIFGSDIHTITVFVNDDYNYIQTAGPEIAMFLIKPGQYTIKTDASYTVHTVNATLPTEPMLVYTETPILMLGDASIIMHAYLANVIAVGPVSYSDAGVNVFEEPMRVGLPGHAEFTANTIVVQGMVKWDGLLHGVEIYFDPDADATAEMGMLMLAAKCRCSFVFDYSIKACTSTPVEEAPHRFNILGDSYYDVEVEGIEGFTAHQEDAHYYEVISDFITVDVKPGFHYITTKTHVKAGWFFGYFLPSPAPVLGTSADLLKTEYINVNGALMKGDRLFVGGIHVYSDFPATPILIRSLAYELPLADLVMGAGIIDLPGIPLTLTILAEPCSPTFFEMESPLLYKEVRPIILSSVTDACVKACISWGKVNSTGVSPAKSKFCNIELNSTGIISTYDFSNIGTEFFQVEVYDFTNTLTYSYNGTVEVVNKNLPLLTVENNTLNFSEAEPELVYEVLTKNFLEIYMGFGSFNISITIQNFSTNVLETIDFEITIDDEDMYSIVSLDLTGWKENYTRSPVSITTSNLYNTETKAFFLEFQEPLELMTDSLISNDLVLMNTVANFSLISLSLIKGEPRELEIYPYGNDNLDIVLYATYEQLKTFNYTLPGVFTPIIKGLNKVSSFSQTLPPVTVYEPLRPCEVNTTRQLYTINETIILNYTNPDYVPVNVSLYINGEYNTMKTETANLSLVNASLVGFIFYYQAAVGNGNACIRMTRGESLCECCTEFIVENYITNLAIEIANQTSQPICNYSVVLNEEIEILISHSDTYKSNYSVDLGDGNAPFSPLTPNFTHVYTEYTPDCLNITVNASNALSNATSTCFFCISLYIPPFENLTMAYTFGNTSTNIDMQITFDGGEDFTCLIDFTDGSPVIEMSYAKFNVGVIEFNHTFEVAWEYHVQVYCFNIQHKLNFTGLVVVQDLVIPPFVECVAVCGEGGAEIAGIYDVKERIYIFPDCDMRCKVMDQEAQNVTAVVEFVVGPYKDISPVINGSSYHNLSPRGGVAKATVYSQNLVSSDVKELSGMLLVKRIMDFNLVHLEAGVDIQVNVATQFTVELASRAYNPCVEILPGYDDQLEIMGPDSCITLTYNLITAIHNEKIEENVVIPFEHVYSKPGMYTMEVRMINIISSVTKNVTFRVIDFPCQAPKVYMQSAFAESIEDVSQTQYKKCEAIPISISVEPQCVRPSTKPYNSILILPQDPAMNIEFNTIQSDIDLGYVIEANLLTYGIYKISITTVMKDDVTLEEVAGTTTVTDTYMEIVPCEFVSVIVGGDAMSFVVSAPFSVSAEGSYDPDRRAGLRYQWYISREEGIMNDPQVVTDAPQYHRSGDSFEDSLTAHFEGNNSVAYLVGKGQNGMVLKVDEIFMELGCYDLALRLTNVYDKNGIYESIRQRKTDKLIKVCLTLNPPVRPVVECGGRNCGEKMKTHTKFCALSFSPNVEDPNTVKYSWQVMRFENKAWINSTVDILPGVMTSLSSSNLCIKSNIMKHGVRYRFVVTAVAPNFDPGIAMLDMLTNDKPDVSNAQCTLSPSEGLEGKTDFTIQCSGATDRDTPLAYKLMYMCNEKVGWKYATLPLYLFPFVFTGFRLPRGEIGCTCYVNVIVADSHDANSEPIQGQHVKVLPVDHYLRSHHEKECHDEPLAVLAAIQSAAKDTSGDSTQTLTRKRRSVEGFSLCDEVGTDNIRTNQLLLANYIAVIHDMLPNLEGKDRTYCKEKGYDATLALKINTIYSSIFLSENFIYTSNGNGISKVDDILKTFEDMPQETMVMVARNLISTGSSLTRNVTGDQAADLVESSISSEAYQLEKIASRMVKYETAIVFTNQLAVYMLACLDLTAPQNFHGFSLPPLLTEDEQKETCTGVVTHVGVNRYDYKHSLAKQIIGPMKSISLSGRKVSDLPVPFTMILPNPLPVPSSETFTAYCRLLRSIHRIDAFLNGSSIVMKVRPTYETNFTGNLFLFMNKGLAPSLSNNDYNHTLPNPQPADWHSMSNESRAYWLSEKQWTWFLTGYQLNKTAVGIWCVGVIFVKKGENVADALLPMHAEVSEDNCSKPINYTFQANTRNCLYWNKEIRNWDDYGCSVVPWETNDWQTKCACNHFTDFGGGGPFAEMVPIDLAATMREKVDIEENPTVFTVVMLLFGFYLVLWLWCRRMDIKDKKSITICALGGNGSEDEYVYNITITTGWKSGAGTTANVAMVVGGTDGESTPQALRHPHKKCFQAGATDRFLLTTGYSLGSINTIELWHDNSGTSPGWYCMQVTVNDVRSEKTYQFVCNKWLDVAEDDGLISCSLHLADPASLVEFDFLFMTMLRRLFYDGHIWISILTRSAESTFTRCQRLATCFSLLMSMMITNAMFYRGEKGPPSQMITIGPFKFSVDQVKIAFTSCLIVMPINMIIVLLFKKAGPKERPNPAYEVKEEYKNTEEKNRSLCGKMVRFLRYVLFPGEEDNDEERLAKKRNPPPYWLIHLAYLIAFVTSVLSAYFVCMYGFAFGRLVSNQWIVSMMFTFAQSFFIFQPLKVVSLAFLFAILVKAPPRDDDSEDVTIVSGMEMTGQLTERSRNQTMDLLKLPEDEELEQSRASRLKEKRIKTILNEIFVHLSFLILCLVVIYSTADPASYNLYKSIKDLCADTGITKALYEHDEDTGLYKIPGGYKDLYLKIPTANEITTRREWWNWMKYSVVEYLFPKGFYTEGFRYPPAFTADSASSKVIAMARIRQLRVKPMSCTKHPVFKYLIWECNAGYSWSSEQTDSYKAGWKPPMNETEVLRRRKGKRKAWWKGLEDPWVHQGVDILKNPFPFTGRFATYPGPSYSVSIGPNRRYANNILDVMKKDIWVDRYTRALFLEMNIYNANSNIMAIVTFLHEILPTGGWNFFPNIQSIRLYRYAGGMANIILIFDFIFCAVTSVGIYKASKAIKRHGLVNYMANFWNLLHFVVTFCSLAAILFTIGRMIAVKEAANQFYLEPELFVSFNFVGQLDYLIVGSLGFVIFFTNLEFLRILRFNYLIAMLMKTMTLITEPLGSFAAIFMVMFMAYVSFAHCIYVDKLEEFQSVLSSFISLTKMFLGKFKVNEYFDNAPFFGPLMFASYMLSIQMVMINLFVGLICDAFAEVGESEDEDEDKSPSIMEYLSARARALASGIEPGENPIYTGWKDEQDVMIEHLNENCDTCIYMMRNIEGEENRLERFFREPTDEMRQLIADIIDDLDYEAELCDGIQLMNRKVSVLSPEKKQVFKRRATQSGMLKLDPDFTLPPPAPTEEVIFEEEEKEWENEAIQLPPLYTSSMASVRTARTVYSDDDDSSLFDESEEEEFLHRNKEFKF